MSHRLTRLVVFNHGPSADAEKEYDRLRDLARKEHGQYQHFASEAHKAYEKGDGAGAHRMSEEGKKHAAQADAYNKQASEFIFRENNAQGKVAGDTIDQHGQFVEEAEEIVEQRIRYAQKTGQTHLHVIVGKGNHSPDHIQKIKPKVEEICREMGLQYNTEENEGRIYVNLQGHGADPHVAPGYDYDQHHQPQHQNYGKPHYETAYPAGNNAKYSYSQAAQGMQYSKPPPQQMETEEPQKKESKCCGLCVVM